MNVVCGQCGTEYEFDDALVSARGTTVKCTSCSHQFRVMPLSSSARIAPERWIIRKRGGNQLEFTSLGDLQRAIASRAVTLEDHFSKDGQPFRAMQEVAELLPFFQRSLSPPAATSATPIPAAALPTQTPPVVQTPAWPPFMAKGTLIGMQAPQVRPRDPLKDTLASAVDTSLAQGPSAEGASRITVRLGPAEFRAPEPEPSTLPVNPIPPEPPSGAAPPFEGASAEESPPESTGGALPRRGRYAADEPWDETTPGSHSRPPPSRVPASFVPLPLSVPPPPKRASGMRWVVALVVIGVLALLAGTVGRKYLAQFTPPASTEPKSNERVDALIASAGRHLGAGDLEAAKAEYDKASVLSEKHPHVLLGITRIEAIRADRLWLQLRLLTPEPSPTREAAANEMRLRMGKLQAALAEATGANPDPVQLTRLQVDALRLAGETEQARKRADGMSSAASDPETAYALAALDISDTAPNWPTVLSRLETAMAGEHGVGRAQALLIYALTLSGDYDAAKRELERLSSSAVPHPLTDALSAFLKARLEAVPAEAVSAGGPSASPVASAAVPGEGASAGEADFRTHLERASKARNSGQLVQAAELYQAALRQQPQNVEALAGLADIAKRQGQTATAQSYFEQVLSRNPGFLPALMGSADIKWGEGDKAGAVALYKRIGPNNVYSEKAEQRIAQHAGSHSDAPAHPWEEGTAPAAPQPSDSSEAPHIDESDLAPQDRDPSPPHVDVSDLPE